LRQTTLTLDIYKRGVSAGERNTMATCKICEHPKRPEIEAAMDNESIRDVARQFELSKDVVARHKAHMRTESEQLCASCRFWLRDECRRYPPLLGDANATRWPRTEPSAWCGEHRT